MEMWFVEKMEMYTVEKKEMCTVEKMEMCAVEKSHCSKIVWLYFPWIFFDGLV